MSTAMAIILFLLRSQNYKSCIVLACFQTSVLPKIWQQQTSCFFKPYSAKNYIAESANSADPDVAAHNEPPDLGQHCLPLVFEFSV